MKLPLLAFALLSLLSPQAARAEAPLKDVLIKDVPHVRQKSDFCGEACAEMFLKKLGKNITQDDVFNASGVDPLLGRGCYTKELAAALQRLGFKVGTPAASVDADKAAAQLEAQWRSLHDDLSRGYPSIVCMRTSDGPNATEHFRLVLGYQAAGDEIIYHEPACGERVEPAEDGAAYRHMKREEFLRLWPLKYEAQRWTVIRLRLEPGAIKEPSRAAGFTNADYAQHVMELKKKIPAGGGFTLALAAPFVVVGDEPAVKVKQRATSTVKWAVDKLKADYFPQDPPEIIDVWLFKDDESYRRNAKDIFGDTPSTPFGYYSDRNRALVMNIATGGGTLVHEIVHPFMRANFPDCPAWFNEGLGSLYEQSAERAGHIVGLTNWRLAGLQKAIKDGRLPTFEKLTATTDTQFYSEDRGTNYAQARYLLYYLQERSLLVKFYKDFLAARKDDPTGYKTLVKVLGESDMAAFQKKWEDFILKLRFP